MKLAWVGDEMLTTWNPARNKMLCRSSILSELKPAPVPAITKINGAFPF